MGPPPRKLRPPYPHGRFPPNHTYPTPRSTFYFGTDNLCQDTFLRSHFDEKVVSVSCVWVCVGVDVGVCVVRARVCV